MKIGIFGGTFNPPHNGHIELVRKFVNTLELDKILIIPTFIPPHKQSEQLPPPSVRLEMCRTAFSEIEKAEISDIEMRRRGKSYTVDTLEEIKKLYPNSEIYFLVGSDMLLSFRRWYKWERILELATLCAGDRDEIESCSEADSKVLENTILLNGKKFIVSSTEIRNKAHNGEDISSLVPEKLYKYINEKGIYNA